MINVSGDQQRRRAGDSSYMYMYYIISGSSRNHNSRQPLPPLRVDKYSLRKRGHPLILSTVKYKLI